MMENAKAILKIIIVDIIVIIILKLCLVFLWPFVIAILLTLLIEPMIEKIMLLGIKRTISVCISLIIIILSTSSLVFIFGKYIINEVNRMLAIVQQSSNIIFLRKATESISLLNAFNNEFINRAIGTISEVINIFIVIIITMFISFDFDSIYNKFKTYVNNNYIIAFIESFDWLTKILIIELKLVFITTMLTIIGFYILGIENALTIGIICGILDLLPVVGPAIIFIPWSIYLLIQKNMFLAIGLICLYLLLQLIREIMQIKMVGNSLKIHPALSLFSLYLGILIFGLWGIIFGPFLIIFTKELIGIEGRII